MNKLNISQVTTDGDVDSGRSFWSSWRLATRRMQWGGCFISMVFLSTAITPSTQDRNSSQTPMSSPRSERTVMAKRNLRRCDNLVWDSGTQKKI